MPLTLVADMVGAERAHAAIKDVMHEPGASRVVGLYDALRDLAAPLHHGLTAPGGHLGGGNPAYGSTRHAKARSPWRRSSRTSARDCTKASGLRTATIRARSSPPKPRSSGSSGPPPAISRSSRCGRVGACPPFSPCHRDDWGRSRSQYAQTGLRNCAPDRNAVSRRRSRRGMSAARRRARRCAKRLADRCRRRRPTRSPCCTNLAARADAGIVASAGPRYFGFVTGGAVPVTVAADWIGSGVGSERLPLCDVAGRVGDRRHRLELDSRAARSAASASVGFVTGCHMANFTCLAAARHEVLRRAGWNVETQGLQQAPRVRVIAGGEVHISAVGALRYLGFGTDEIELVPVDGQGRMRADALDAALARLTHGPDHRLRAGRQRQHRRERSDRRDRAKRACAWRLGARRRRLRPLGRRRSRAAIAGRRHRDGRLVGHRRAQMAQRSVRLRSRDRRRCRAASRGDEHEGVVPAARRRRGAHRHGLGAGIVTPSRVLPLYALFRSLGRDGIADIVRRNCALARRMADRLSQEPGMTILNDVVLESGAGAVQGRRDDASGDRGGAGRRHVLGRRRVLAEHSRRCGSRCRTGRRRKPTSIDRPMRSSKCYPTVSRLKA